MKILLDENINIHFKKYFPAPEYEVYTVRDMNWNGIKNGKLLALLKEYNFDCWIVVDKNLPYQQNLSALPCSIIILDVIRNILENLVPLLPEIFTELDAMPAKQVIVIPRVL